MSPPNAITANPRLTSRRSVAWRPAQPAGSDRKSPGNINSPISVPTSVQPMPNRATSGSAVEARDWNCRPRLAR